MRRDFVDEAVPGSNGGNIGMDDGPNRFLFVGRRDISAFPQDSMRDERWHGRVFRTRAAPDADSARSFAPETNPVWTEPSIRLDEEKLERTVDADDPGDAGANLLDESGGVIVLDYDSHGGVT